MNQQLLNYITEAHAHGMSDEDIRRELIAAGWSEQEIGIAINPGFSQTTSGSQQFWNRYRPYYAWIGLTGILVGALITFFVWSDGVSMSIGLWIALYTLVVSFMQSLILFTLAKILKVEDNLFAKALLLAGIGSFATAVYSLLYIAHLPAVLISLALLGITIGWFVTLIKLYALSFGKGIALAMLQGIIGGVVSVILFLTLALTGLLSFSQLFQSQLQDAGSSPSSLEGSPAPQLTPSFAPSATPIILNTQKQLSPTQVYGQYFNDIAKMKTFDDYAVIVRKYNSRLTVLVLEEKLPTASEEYKKNVFEFIKFVHPAQIKGFVNVVQSNNRATFTVTTEEPSVTLEVIMVLENGVWKVDADNLNSRLNK